MKVCKLMSGDLPNMSKVDKGEEKPAAKPKKSKEASAPS